MATQVDFLKFQRQISKNGFRGALDKGLNYIINTE